MQVRSALEIATRQHAAAEGSVRSLRAQLEAEKAVAGEEDPECVTARGRLSQEAASLDLPAGALDSLVDALGGPTRVAEMTGRKGRMVRTPDGRRFAHVQRAKPESAEMENLNVAERNAFMDGKKLIAISDPPPALLRPRDAHPRQLAPIPSASTRPASIPSAST